MLERPHLAQPDTPNPVEQWAHARLAEQCEQLGRQCHQAEALFGHDDVVARRGAQTFTEFAALLSHSARDCGSWR